MLDFSIRLSDNPYKITFNSKISDFLFEFTPLIEKLLIFSVNFIMIKNLIIFRQLFHLKN